MTKIGRYDVTHPVDVLRQRTIVKRDADPLALPATINGIYNQLLFDLCGDNDLVSLSLMGAYNRALDAVGFVTSNVHHIHEDMITYVSAEGAAAGTPSSGVHVNPCAPGTSVESGGCAFELTGWGRLRRASEVRDVTEVMLKFCETQPRYNIAGQMISNDYEWDVVRIMSVLIHDFQRLFITGSALVAGQADGLELLVNYGYTNPDNAELCTAMDSTVVDYNGNAMCPTNGAVGVTVNGAAVADGWRLIDFIKAFLRRTQTRIQMSSLVGAPLHIGLIPTATLTCLINCYVCDLVCGGDVERMDSFEARAKLTDLQQQFGAGGTILLTFDGYPVLFYAYDWELWDSVTDTSDIYILTPTVGTTPLVRIQVKDMSEALRVTDKSGTEFRVTDQNRVLSWENWDNTCYQVNSEMQWRVYMPAPWAQMRITNVACDTILGQISGDPLSPAFIEGNLIAHAEA
jgi:hypothetical protein